MKTRELTEYYISINGNYGKNKKALKLIDETKNVPADAVDIARGKGYYLRINASKKEMEHIKKQFEELNVKLNIDEERVLIAEDFSIEYLKKLYSLHKDQIKKMKSLVFEFTQETPDRCSLMVYTVSTGKTYSQSLKNRDAWGLSGRFEFESSEYQYLDESFSLNVIQSGLDSTLEVFQTFAESIGLKQAKSMGCSGENNEYFHIWIGNDTGKTNVTFKSLEKEWTNSIVEELVNYSIANDSVLENAVLYFGGENLFELFYINNEQLNGPDEALKDYMSKGSFTKGAELVPSNEILPVSGTPFVSLEELQAFYPPFEQLLTSNEVLWDPVKEGMNFILYRICANLERGKLFKDKCKTADELNFFSVFHDMESKISWELRKHARETLNKPIEQYIDTWFQMKYK
ncbi:MAG: hypothetical protein MJB14_18520 [Spirochaetes bacterium]|nr:hypothetical protein [Spirochaetota bacterium]